ncbi:MAG: winged helix-turn-helix domain-containing protein [Acidobacteria bacterium]|nr:winged helix-turn-helix domain-containing protein [Acidobacteriota bacterium]
MDTSTDTGGTLRFGAFELDVRSRELRRGDRCIRLQDQPFEILRMMLERPGDVVTRDELRRRLWPDGTFVDFEHSLNAAVKRLRAALGDDADNPRFVETLPRRGYRFIGHTLAEAAGDSAGTARLQVRLAVLPFTTLSESGAQEYFTDGLTEEMIAQLGQLCRGRIGVVARWSSMVFKGTTERAREIGRALRADYLLEGSVRREADRVRITVRLIEAAGETQLWAETYERHLTDCLSVQADVAARVAESLALELVADTEPPAGGATASVSAYQEYLKGRYHWNNQYQVEDEALDRAMSHYTTALRIDPQFAPARAGIARAHVARAVEYRERPRPALEAARAEAKRALELNGRLSEAHVALADVRRMLEWDWRGAEAAYLDAIALNPSQENAHRLYGVMLVMRGRRDEAIREVGRAHELDPLCLVVGTSAALVCSLAGDDEAALAYCRRITDIDPQYPAARRILAAVYLRMGRLHDAIAVLEAAYPDARHDPLLVASLVHARSVVGDRAAAADLLGALRQLARTRYLPPYYLALAHVGLGDADAAFAALEQAVVDCDPALGYLAVEPCFAAIRADARYGRLLELLCLR